VALAAPEALAVQAVTQATAVLVGWAVTAVPAVPAPMGPTVLRAARAALAQQAEQAMRVWPELREPKVSA